MRRALSLVWIALSAAVCAASPAVAHPHMFADARLDVTLTPDGKAIESLRHIWRFDDFSSSTMLVDLDTNGDGSLDEKELKEAGKIMKESMGEYKYFQLVTVDGKDVDMDPPDEMVPSWENNLLYVMFTSRPKHPLPLAGKVDIGVYDPTFYVAIDFTEDDKLVVHKLPANCTKQVIRPDPDQAIAQNQATLDQAFLDPNANNDMSKIFATKLELDCKPAG